MRYMVMRIRGFTLVELMMVAAILGIIIAIAIPSYTRWALQSRRSDAHRILATIVLLQERRLSECAAYTTTFTGNITDCASGGLGLTSSYSPDKHYEVTITAPTTTSYTLSAAPVPGGVQQQDTVCPTITLNSLGLKGPSANCW